MTPVPLRWKFFSSYSRRYAAAGALLGLGSPLGLLVLRLLDTFDGGWTGWLRAEFQGLWPIYAYTGIGSMAVFAAFGFILGKKEDAMLSHVHKVEENAGRLEHRFMKDPVTGVYARSYLMQRLAEELARARRYRYPLGCLFIDVDRFKEINDRYGHLFGDLALTEVAKSMLAAMRDSDILGRYGGDEFLAILPETGITGAYRAAERLRRNVEHLTIVSQAGAVHPTVSVGIYASDRPPASTEVILEAADAGLRRAKGTGRNRSVLMAGRESDAAAEGGPTESGPGNPA